MGGSCRDADCFRARDTDFTQMIAWAGIGNDSFSALSIARIGPHRAAAQHNRRDAIEDHRRHNDEWHRGRVHIFERRRTRQRLSVIIEQMQRRRRHVSARTRIGVLLSNWSSFLVVRIGDYSEPVPRMTGIADHIQRWPLIGRRRVAWRLAELTIRAIAVEGCSGGESDAAIVLLENVAVVNGSDFSHENVDLALTTFGLMNYDDRGKNNFARPVGVALAKSNTALTSIL